MKRKWLLFVLLAWFSGQAQYDQLLHKTHGQRFPHMYQIYVGTITDPRLDSATALREVNAIARVALENGDEDLFFETRILLARYYHYQAVFGKYPAEAAKARLLALLEEAKQKGKIWGEAKLEGLYSMQCYNMKQYEVAFEHFQRLYNIGSEANSDQFPDIKNFLCEFANQLYLFRDYRLALRYLKEASKDSVRVPGDFYVYQCPNTMGLCYRALNQLDSSSYYFNIVHNIAVKLGNRWWVAIANGNLGENYFIEKQYARAKPLLQDDADISAREGDWGLAANAVTILAQISIEENELALAEKQLAQARDYAYRSKQYKRLGKLYPVLERYYIARRDPVMASVYQDSSHMARDSLERQFNTLNMVRAQQKVDLEKHKLVLAELNSQEKLGKLQRNALIVLIVLTAVIALFIYDKQKRRIRQKNEQLENAKEALNNFTKSITEKNILIEQLQEQIGHPDSEVLQQLQQSTILTEDQWQEFKNLFAKVHRGYLNRLQEKLPGLTPAETRFMALSKLKLSSKEMASMLGVGPDAIRQYRLRVRKKLNLGEEENLDELIAKI